MLLEEQPLRGVGDYEAGTEATEEGRRGWMDALSAMSKGGGFFTGQSKYYPHS
jgi:hypothetical protein